MIKVAILGSTGSVGRQALQVVEANADVLAVHSLVAYSNEKLLDSQRRRFSPRFCGLISQGEQCLLEAVRGADVALVATRGITALPAVLFCLDNGIKVALANKETLVCGGALVADKVRQGGVLAAVDSEHCAVSQCLLGRDGANVRRILLTASGGPFWEYDSERLSEVTAEQALAHPNWNMGQKITIDSATMMNKALEVVEAHWLFGVPSEKISVVVHRQSVVHSMVEWDSGGVMAQLARPDMKLPIQIALLGEGKSIVPPLDFSRLTLTFEQCDFKKFPCARLGHEILSLPSLCATAMNGANDVCVEMFLRGRLRFTQFYPVITQTVQRLQKRCSELPLTVDNIKKIDAEAQKTAALMADEIICC